MTAAATPLPRRAHAARAAELLAAVATGLKPADQLLEALFRNHREMGKRDRAAVSGLVYGVLRDLLRLQALAGGDAAAWLARHLADAGHAAEAITALGLPAPVADRTELPAHVRLNLPEDWYQRLRSECGEPETAALAAALNFEAPVDLRVNTLKGSREQVRELLAAEGVEALPTPHSPWGLRLSRRLAQSSAVLTQGWAEPQDEGSQLLALLTAAASGETVVDYCAGAGGKSLALAAMMKDRGRLIACDLHASRLARIAPRAQRAGVHCLQTRALESPEVLADLHGKADMVLVDAPCSGSGTLRRAPDLRLRVPEIAPLAALQGQILGDAARLLKPGGRLVYATCSLFQAENEAVVAAFLATHPDFERDARAAQRVPLANADGSLRLWPHRQDSDGFFGCALRRVMR